MTLLIVGSDQLLYLNAFYEPFGSSQWSMSGEQAVGMVDNLSIAWSGSEVYLALACGNGVYVQGYSDVGIPDGYGDFVAVYESSSSQVTDYISWSGSNAVLVSKDASGNLDFFCSNSNVTNFAEETIATDTSTLTYGALPAVVVGHNLVVVTDCTSKATLYAWLQAVGGTGWTQQLIAK